HHVGAEIGPSGDLVDAVRTDRAGADDLEARLVEVTHADASPRMTAAASSTARMILSYPVQRHRLPASQWRTSASVGFGFFSRSARAATMNPGVQMPHCSAACSRNFCCNGCNPWGLAIPSMVVTFRPWTSTPRTQQEFTSLPSRMTLQAPQLPLLQPSLVPVRRSSSRRTSRRLWRG